MDSGNSSSLQSSSGGDEEYDSSINKLDSFVIPQGNNLFLNPGGGNLINSLTSSTNPLHQPSPLLSHQSHPRPTSCRQPSSSPFLGFSQPDFNPSSLLSIDSYNLTRPFVRCTSLENSTLNAFSNPSTIDVGAVHQEGNISSGVVTGQTTLTKEHGPAKNPKKRTRASRRAPTTVLTTDTSNFRAMVQEFTGIPSPPFSASPFSRSRLDFLGSDSIGSSILRPSIRHLNPMGYISGNLLRPSAQKFIPSPNVNMISPSTGSTSPFVVNQPSSLGYHLGSSLDHILGSHKQNHPEIMLNMQQQLLSSSHQTSVARPPLSSQIGSLGCELPSDSWKDTIESFRHNGNERGNDRLNLEDGSNKFNHFAGPPSDRSHHDKSLDTAGVPTRGEGTFASWSCPID